MGPSWAHVGQKIDFWRFPKACKNDHDFQHLSGPSWDRFWNDLGIQNRTKIGLRSVSRAIMKQMQRSSKVTAPPKVFCFMIALETHLGPILARFWIPKPFQNRSQEGPERCWKSLSFLHAFRNLQKSISWPTWPPLGPQDGPKLEPKWDQNQTEKGLGSEIGSRADFGSMFGRCLADFG